MKIIVSNNIKIKDPDKQILDWCEENLVIKNPDYEKNKRLGYSTWKIPKTLCWYTINGNELILPFGCLQDLFQMYSKDMFENRIVEGEKITYKSNIKLYDYQEEACQVGISAKNGIIVSPAGSGKTQTALEMIARLGLKTLWLTHTSDLLRTKL